MKAPDVVPQTASSAALAPVLPVDPGWHDESVLLAELATVNQSIARYITHMLDADAGRREAVDPAARSALGRRLVNLGQCLQALAHAVSREPTHPGSG